MKKIISYSEIPYSIGQSIYLRMETDPKLFANLLSRGYKIVKNIKDANENTIYVTGRRQDYRCSCCDEYFDLVNKEIQESLKDKGIVKPNTTKFSYDDLLNYKYKIPFVFKNENQNGGREKFLINTEQDYENLINACVYLINKNYLLLTSIEGNNQKCHIDYDNYLNLNFVVQEYIETPTEFNTTLRLLTTPSNDLLYGVVKYKEKDEYKDDTTLLGYLLNVVYPLSTKSIVSNTLSGGSNLLLGEENYNDFEKKLLDSHNINTDDFFELVEKTKTVHKEFQKEIGIICGFDYIYDKEKEKWFLLEYHSRPMVGDYSKRQGILYKTKEDRQTAEGRIRATALKLMLKKTR